MGIYISYILCFFIYSFLGWICETIYCSVGGKKFINRGFLNGPICPIYGFGALFVILFLRPYSDNMIVLFICSIIVTSTLEYIASALLEKMFNAKWWDYSNKILNLNGRICVKNSLIFGVMGVILINNIHPKIKDVINIIPTKIMYCIAIVLVLWLITEISTTINSIKKLDKKLEGLDKVDSELKSINVCLEKYNSEEIKRIISELNINDISIKNKLDEIGIKLNKIKSKSKIQKRLINAYPNMKHKKHHKQLQKLKEIFKDKNKY